MEKKLRFTKGPSEVHYTVFIDRFTEFEGHGKVLMGTDYLAIVSKVGSRWINFSKPGEFFTTRADAAWASAPSLRPAA